MDGWRGSRIARSHAAGGASEFWLAGSSGADALKLIFRHLVEKIRLGTQTFGVRKAVMLVDGNEHECYEAAEKFCTLAVALIASQFFKDCAFDSTTTSLDASVKRSRFTTEEQHWLNKLRRRLWRAARYKTDAHRFADAGLKFIRKALGPVGLANFQGGEGGMKIDWVGAYLTYPRSHGMSYVWPQSPSERLEGLLKQYNISVDVGILKDVELRRVQVE
jgi:hypothetical protein